MRRPSFIGLAAVLLLIPAALAAPAPEAKPKTESPSEKIKKALDQTIDLEINEQPLRMAVEQFKEQTKVNFVLDRVVLATLGIDPETMAVTIKQKGVKARVALRSFLTSNNLAYAVVGDSILISSEDGAIYRQFKQKVSVDVDKAPLAAALKDLAKETGINVLVDKKVTKEAQGEVSLQLDEVPLEAAVRLLCEQASLKPVRLGNVVYVTAKATAAELRTEPELAPSPRTIPGIEDIIGNPPGGPPGGPGVPAPGRPAIGGAAAPTVATPIEVSPQSDPKFGLKKEEDKPLPDKKNGR
jgi:type II secretory pathway component HofQ